MASDNLTLYCACCSSSTLSAQAGRNPGRISVSLSDGNDFGVVILTQEQIEHLSDFLREQVVAYRLRSD